LSTHISDSLPSFNLGFSFTDGTLLLFSAFTDLDDSGFTGVTDTEGFDGGTLDFACEIAIKHHVRYIVQE
jgi:hypothetical protein